MGRATIGESGADKAMNRMEKHMERSARRGDQASKVPTLLDQIKATYPDTWKEEIEEMRREQNDPDYLARKKQARKDFAADYYKQSRVDRDYAGISEQTYVARRMVKWREENK